MPVYVVFADKEVHLLFMKHYTFLIFFCFLCHSSFAVGPKGDDLQGYLTNREKIQAAGEMKEQFPVASAAKPLPDDPEYQTYYRLSVDGKHVQIWDRVLVMSLLAIVCITIRAKK